MFLQDIKCILDRISRMHRNWFMQCFGKFNLSNKQFSLFLSCFFIFYPMIFQTNFSNDRYFLSGSNFHKIIPVFFRHFFCIFREYPCCNRNMFWISFTKFNCTYCFLFCQCNDHDVIDMLLFTSLHNIFKIFAVVITH